MAMAGGEIMGFVQRFRDLSAHRDSSEQLIKDLLIYCERVETALAKENARLREQLSNANLDYEDATKSRRELQQHVQRLQAEIEYSEHLKNRNPYVMVLIDGDGLIFQETFIRQGIEGGKKAAYMLRMAIAEQCPGLSEDIEVIAKVCTNMAGLAKAMKRDGSIEVENDLRDFALGFTQSLASFDFIDVGHGKERADSKVKEATRWNLRNFNCKQIVLGISHDAGYAPFLDEILRDENSRQRVTILEGFPTVRELKATGVHIMNLTETLFRSDKLVDKALRNPSPPFATSPPISSSVITPPVPTPSSWAGVAMVPKGASPPPQLILPLMPKPVNSASRTAKPTLWNPGRRGLDKSITYSQAVLDVIKKRKDSDKLCNNHYLRGPCTKGDMCCFEHGYKPNQDEKNAIAYLARHNPCTMRQDCILEDCIYGHHCPTTVNGQCTQMYCKFSVSAHPPGTKFRPTYSYPE